MATASEALDSARTYLNDVGAQLWSNDALLPYLKEAHRDLQLILWLNSIPVLKERTDLITLSSGDTTLGDDQPDDLIEPIRLSERAVGEADTEFSTMIPKESLEGYEQTNVLTYWNWQGQVINFVGATTDRVIRLTYWKGLVPPTQSTSELNFILAETFLGPQTAQYAASSVGNTVLANEAIIIAKARLEAIVRGNVKGGQRLKARRIPYRRFARSRSLF